MLAPLLSMLLTLTLVSCGKGGGGDHGSAPLSVNEAKNGTQPSQNPTRTEVSEPASNEIESIKAVRQVELEPDHSNIAEFRDSINDYYIKIKFVSKQQMAKVTCNKLLYNGKLHNEVTVSVENSSDASLPAKIDFREPNKVSFECFGTTDGKKSKRRIIDIKQSFVITKEQDIASAGLANKGEIATLLFEKDSRLLTGDAAFELTVDELVSLGGELATFSEESSHNKVANTKGPSGSVINLTANVASGDLKVVLRGMSGGESTVVPDDLTSTKSAGGELNGSCSSRGRSNNQNCYGKKGYKGDKGTNGSAGFAGGDSGSLVLTVKRNDHFKVMLDYSSGKGSAGTKGGHGSYGSSGGSGARVTWETFGGGGQNGSGNSYTHEYTYPSGDTGDRGDDGDEGVKGEDGKNLESTIVIEDQKYQTTGSWNN